MSSETNAVRRSFQSWRNDNPDVPYLLEIDEGAAQLEEFGNQLQSTHEQLTRLGFFNEDSWPWDEDDVSQIRMTFWAYLRAFSDLHAVLTGKPATWDLALGVSDQRHPSQEIEIPDNGLARGPLLQNAAADRRQHSLEAIGQVIDFQEEIDFFAVVSAVNRLRDVDRVQAPNGPAVEAVDMVRQRLDIPPHRSFNHLFVDLATACTKASIGVVKARSYVRDHRLGDALLSTFPPGFAFQQRRIMGEIMTMRSGRDFARRIMEYREFAERSFTPWTSRQIWEKASTHAYNVLFNPDADAPLRTELRLAGPSSTFRFQGNSFQTFWHRTLRPAADVLPATGVVSQNDRFDKSLRGIEDTFGDAAAGIEQLSQHFGALAQSDNVREADAGTNGLAAVALQRQQFMKLVERFVELLGLDPADVPADLVQHLPTGVAPDDDPSVATLAPQAFDTLRLKARPFSTRDFSFRTLVPRIGEIHKALDDAHKALEIARLEQARATWRHTRVAPRGLLSRTLEGTATFWENADLPSATIFTHLEERFNRGAAALDVLEDSEFGTPFDEVTHALYRAERYINTFTADIGIDRATSVLYTFGIFTDANIDVTRQLTLLMAHPGLSNGHIRESMTNPISSTDSLIQVLRRMAELGEAETRQSWGLVGLVVHLDRVDEIIEALSPWDRALYDWSVANRESGHWARHELSSVQSAAEALRSIEATVRDFRDVVLDEEVQPAAQIDGRMEVLAQIELAYFDVARALLGSAARTEITSSITPDTEMPTGGMSRSAMCEGPLADGYLDSANLAELPALAHGATEATRQFTNGQRPFDAHPAIADFIESPLFSDEEKQLIIAFVEQMRDGWGLFAAAKLDLVAHDIGFALSDHVDHSPYSLRPQDVNVTIGRAAIESFCRSVEADARGLLSPRRGLALTAAVDAITRKTGVTFRETLHDMVNRVPPGIRQEWVTTPRPFSSDMNAMAAKARSLQRESHTPLHPDVVAELDAAWGILNVETIRCRNHLNGDPRHEDARKTLERIEAFHRQWDETYAQIVQLRPGIPAVFGSGNVDEQTFASAVRDFDAQLQPMERQVVNGLHDVAAHVYDDATAVTGPAVHAALPKSPYLTSTDAALLRLHNAGRLHVESQRALLGNMIGDALDVRPDQRSRVGRAVLDDVLAQTPLTDAITSALKTSGLPRPQSSVTTNFLRSLSGPDDDGMDGRDGVEPAGPTQPPIGPASEIDVADHGTSDVVFIEPMDEALIARATGERSHDPDSVVDGEDLEIEPAVDPTDALIAEIREQVRSLGRTDRRGGGFNRGIGG